MSADDVQAIRAARNQTLFREVNERIEDLNVGFGMVLPMGEWVCECADETCSAPMELTVPEYEAIRAHPSRFPVLPGHEQPEVERVVERHSRYVVVEKMGVAAEFAREHDRRSDARSMDDRDAAAL